MKVNFFSKTYFNFKNYTDNSLQKKSMPIKQNPKSNFYGYLNSMFAINKALISFQGDRIGQKYKDLIISLHNQGKNSQEIAEEIGCSRSTIARLLMYYDGGRSLKVSSNIEKVKELVEKGKSVKEIASILDYSPGKVYVLIRESGIEYKNLTERHKDQIIELYQRGYSHREIGQMVGCNGKSVTRALKKWGFSQKVDDTLFIEKYKEQMLKLHQQGKTPEEIGFILDTSAYRIAKALKSLGIKVNMKPEGVDKYICELAKQNLSPKEISQKVGINPDSIRHILRKYGVEVLRSERNKDEIIRLYGEGKSLKDIASIMGCHYQTIYGVLKKWGIK